jgi:hypothetical protein
VFLDGGEIGRFASFEVAGGALDDAGEALEIARRTPAGDGGVLQAGAKLRDGDALADGGGISTHVHPRVQRGDSDQGES